jgi:hypothetical protein
MDTDQILKTRLFGYGTPYRVGVGADGILAPLDTTAEGEAEALATLLSALGRDLPEVPIVDTDPWAYSMPFGRCGIEGLPREHIQVHFSREAYLDVLDGDGVTTHALSNGQIVAIEPGSIVRLRARALCAGRVLVAFQTQDHTPLHGNAGPFMYDGAVPEDWQERLIACHAAFDRVAAMTTGDRREVLDSFFFGMASSLAGGAEIDALRSAAEAAGSYTAPDEAPFFTRQETLLDERTVGRIRQADAGVFRFPGMFGGVAPLFSLID